jgi:hypothetical protein
LKDQQSKVKPDVAALKALFVTQQNSKPATGENLKFWKFHYPHLVRRIGRKDVIVTAELERAVQGNADIAVSGKGDTDPAEAVRSILRRAGGQ